MKKTLDFNALEKPTLELTMKDKARTVLHVLTPTEKLIEELQAAAPGITAAMEGKDAGMVAEVYGLAAKLISVNQEGIEVTADDLRDPEKYGLGLEYLIIFFSAYLDFINEIAQAKN